VNFCTLVRNDTLAKIFQLMVGSTFETGLAPHDCGLMMGNHTLHKPHIKVAIDYLQEIHQYQ
jgi:hypothetical protein